MGVTVRLNRLKQICEGMRKQKTCTSELWNLILAMSTHFAHMERSWSCCHDGWTRFDPFLQHTLKNNPDEAEAMYLKALKIDPHHVDRSR